MPHFECGAFDHSATSPTVDLARPADDLSGRPVLAGAYSITNRRVQTRRRPLSGAVASVGRGVEIGAEAAGGSPSEVARPANGVQSHAAWLTPKRSGPESPCRRHNAYPVCIRA